MVWYSHLCKSFPRFIMIHKDKGFSLVDETEVDIFLEFSSFLYDRANVGNLISGTSSFFKPSLDIWKFLVCIMLKPSMHDFKYDLSSWFQIGKGVRQGCILSPCLFNLYAEHIMRQKKHKLESRLPGETSITSDMQMTPPLWQKVKRD